jgi:nucleotidyltransferase substrate binding protein (TIGR01987 family)
VDLAGERELSKLERQGLIQAFEFKHELAWNTMKDFLESRGTTGIDGSKDATREAFSRGLLDDGERWMEMIQSRNRTSDTYNEATARQIGDALDALFLPYRFRLIILDGRTDGEVAAHVGRVGVRLFCRAGGEMMRVSS